MIKAEQITVRIEKDLLLRLREQALGEDRSRGAVVRRALRGSLDAAASPSGRSGLGDPV